MNHILSGPYPTDNSRSLHRWNRPRVNGRRFLTIAVAAILSMAADRSHEAPSRLDCASLQGTWVLASFEEGGDPLIPEAIEDARLTFEGRNFHLWQDSGMGIRCEESGTFSLDATKTPKEIHLKFLGGIKGDEDVPGIYDLKADVLKLCLGHTRPVTFATRPNTHLTLEVWKRGTSDRFKLQGVWALVEGDQNGKPFAREAIKAGGIVFSGVEFIDLPAKDPRNFEPDDSGYFKINELSNPKSIDMRYFGGARTGETLLGIYELKDKTLRICLGKSRPARFAAPPGSQETLRVYRQRKVWPERP